MPGLSMTAPPLAIIQARMGSTRLPGKSLADLSGKPLIRHVWEATVEAVGKANVVVATTDQPEDEELARYVVDVLGGQVVAHNGDPNDVLERFFHVANRYRWHPDTIILRVTADDPYKNAEAMRLVLAGVRMPVEIGGEAFTLGALNDAHHLHAPWEGSVNPMREHLTDSLAETPPPPAPPGFTWTIDTPEDLEAVRAQMSQKRIEVVQ